MCESEPQDPLATQPKSSKDESQSQTQSSQSVLSHSARASHPPKGSEQRAKDSSPMEEKDKREKHDHRPITDWIMAGSTVGILIATIVNVCVAYKQWRAMEDQLKEVRAGAAQTERAINTSNQLATAAEQANILRQNADRAFMYAAPHRVFHVEPGPNLQAYIQIGNSGLTVAKNVERWAGVRVMTPPGMDAIKDLKPMMIRQEGLLVVSPRILHNVIRQLPNHKVLTSEDVRDIKSGQKRIYVFGLITYDDAYGKAHSTEFCFMYYGHEHAVYDTGPGYFESQGQYCDKHNETDRER